MFACPKILIPRTASNPFTWFVPRGRLSDLLDDRALGSGPAQIDAPQHFAETPNVAMRIDEARNDRRAFRVDHFCSRPEVTGNIVSDRQYPAMPYSYRGRARLLRIHRINARVRHRQLGCLRQSRRAEGDG